MSRPALEVARRGRRRERSVRSSAKPRNNPRACDGFRQGRKWCGDEEDHAP